MNHLCGLPNIAGNPIDTLLELGERAALATFKASYMEHADANDAVPIWALTKEAVEALPASGWRALDDVTLLRFLRADKRRDGFDHAKSMDRLLAALAWRKKTNSDLLLALPADDDYEHLRIRRWVGADKHGRPVQFERLGEFLCSGNAKAFTADEWLRHYARDLETTFAEMRQASLACGRPVTKYLFVGDFQGGSGVVFHMSTVVPLLKMLTKSVEAHFPEIVDKILIFNAPRIFATMFQVVKAFMDPITAAKVEVYAGVPTGRLLALMDSSTLPVEYGGTNAAPYPLARVFTPRAALRPASGVHRP